MFKRKFSVRTKVLCLVLFASFAYGGYSLWAFSLLSTAKVHGPYYQRIVQGKDLIADILPPPNYIIESYMMALYMADELDEKVDSTTMSEYVERCDQLEKEFAERHAFWLVDLPEGEMKRIKTVDCYEPAIEFYKHLNEVFIPACESGDVDTANSILRSKMKDCYLRHRSAVDQVVQMAVERNTVDEAEVLQIVGRGQTMAMVISFGMFGLLLAAGWWTAKQTSNPLLMSALRLRHLSNDELAGVSQKLRSTAEETADRANVVSGAADQVSENAQSLSSAVAQLEESIKEIASNASGAASVAHNAVGAAKTTTNTITRLGESGNEIGNVIKVILSIAEQTNLLALNATIEAARAGEAGKGFAVVANEVKELAKETSKATTDIIQKIETIQSDTLEAVEAINQVSEIISDINDSQNAIASAVEEQTAMTSEISRNIAKVATGSSDIAQNIGVVAESVQKTTTGSNETMATASNIESVAVELMELVGATEANRG